MVEFCHSLNSRSVKICMVTPGLSLSMQCSYSCSFPGVLWCPQAVTCSVCRVQLSTSTCGTIQCTNKSWPWLGREMQSCHNSSTNMNNNHFSNYFPPFLFSVWPTCISGGHVWRDCSNFSVWDYFQKCSFLEEQISDFVLWVPCGSFTTSEYLFQTGCRWRGTMMCPVGAGSSCGLAQWPHSCFTAPQLPGCACALWSAKGRKWDWLPKKCLVENWKYNIFSSYLWRNHFRRFRPG